jgi:hypothetical protein
MTLPSSGSISASDIRTEFGGSNPISISEYYNGGIYVTNNVTAIAPNVPSSGTIELSDFYGSGKLFNVTFSMSRSADNQNYFYFNSALGLVTATLDFNGSGSITLKFVKNVSYQITANVSKIRLSGNTIQLEDYTDADYNDLEATPNQGTISKVGSNFYYLLT